jgi:hypothetical protein
MRIAVTAGEWLPRFCHHHADFVREAKSLS